jgi:hypothetical protein
MAMDIHVQQQSFQHAACQDVTPASPISCNSNSHRKDSAAFSVLEEGNTLHHSLGVHLPKAGVDGDVVVVGTVTCIKHLKSHISKNGHVQKRKRMGDLNTEE